MSDTENKEIAAVAEEVIVDLVNEVAIDEEEAEKVIEDAANDIEEKVDEVVEEVKETIEEKVEEVVEAVEEKVDEVVTETTELLEEKVEDLKDDILDGLKEKVKEIGVKKSTLALIIKFTMEAVEDTPKKGSEQKDYALRLIRALVVDLASDDEKDFLLTAIDSGSVGDTIDLIVQATQGELNINSVVEVAATSCLPCCLTILSKKTKKAKK